MAGFSFSRVDGTGPILKSAIQQDIDGFLIDRQARGLSRRTVEWYSEQLYPFARHLASQGLAEVEAITPGLLRRYFLDLSRTHNEGGVHGRYRAIRAFLNWWTAETEPQNWKNPIAKVAAPKVPQQPLDPVNLDDLQAMLGTCKRRTYAGDRDKALLMFLLDTGCRRAEFCALTLADVDLRDGSVLA
jgi:integrase/recombinase XerD